MRSVFVPGILISVILLVTACQPAANESSSSEIEFLHMPGTKNLGLPFSSAVRVDNMLYLSGIIGTEPDVDRPVSGGIRAEAIRAMEILQEELEAFGSSMDRVVKCTVFLVDENDRAAFNEIYMSYFDSLPARSGVTVKGLALGARMELECIAVAN
jgi:reactive intermediate/imine deaminase